ncbi:uncharacterized protein [Drosophila pseudoobscura]|uniref:Uncharacterized protein n=1 Tax=Drosophila pseudoobscura pseudoobscura TaxID=46245 RepID=A0A6I8W6K6_DROPS|nr:uncharacterized protein LOC117184499 [Drosophila pseudoobscura]
MSDLISLLSTSEEESTEPDYSVDSFASPESSVLPFTSIEPPEEGQTEISHLVSVDSTEVGIHTSDLISLLSTSEEESTEPDYSVDSFASPESSVLPFTSIEPPEEGQTGISHLVSVDSTEVGILTSALISLLSTSEEKSTEPDPSVYSFASPESSVLPFTSIEPPEEGQTGVSHLVSVDSKEVGIHTSDLISLLSTSEEKSTEPDPSAYTFASPESSVLPFTSIEPPEEGQTGISHLVSVDSTEVGIHTSDLISLLSTSEEKSTEPDPSVDSFASPESSVLPFTSIEPPEVGQTGISQLVSLDPTEVGIHTSDLISLLSTSEGKSTEPDPSAYTFASPESSVLPFTSIEPPEEGQKGVSQLVSVDSTEVGIHTSDLISLLSTSEEKSTEPDPSVDSFASPESSVLPFTSIEPPEVGQTGISQLVSLDPTEVGIHTSDLISLLSTSEGKSTEPDPSAYTFASPESSVLPFTSIEPPEEGQKGVSQLVSVDSTEVGIHTSDLISLLSTFEEKSTEPDPSAYTFASPESSVLPFTSIEPPEVGQTGISQLVSVDSTEVGIHTSDLISLLSTSEGKSTEPEPSAYTFASPESSVLPFTSIETPEDGQTGISHLVSVDSTEVVIYTSDLISLLSTSEGKSTEPEPSAYTFASPESSVLPFTSIETPEEGQTGVSQLVSVDSTEVGIHTSDLISLLSTSEGKSTEPEPSAYTFASPESSVLPFTSIETPEDGQTGISHLVSVDSTEVVIYTSDLISLLSTSEEKSTEADPSVDSFASPESSVLPFTSIEPPEDGQIGTSDLSDILSTAKERTLEPDPSGQPGGSLPVSGQTGRPDMKTDEVSPELASTIPTQKTYGTKSRYRVRPPLRICYDVKYKHKPQCQKKNRRFMVHKRCSIL